MLKYGLILPTYRIKVDLCYCYDTTTIHNRVISYTQKVIYIIQKNFNTMGTLFFISVVFLFGLMLNPNLKDTTEHNHNQNNF